MTGRRVAPALLTLLALVPACNRKRNAPPAPQVAASPEAAAPAVAWSFYELGSLIVIEGEVDKPTRLSLQGATLNEEREAELGPVRWELYKPAQTQEVELRDHEGRRLGAWTFQGLRAKTHEAPPPMAPPSNGGPSDYEVAALASKITWTSAGNEGRKPEAPQPPPHAAPPGPALPVPAFPSLRAGANPGIEGQDLRGVTPPPRTSAPPPEPPPRVGQVPTSRLALPQSRAGMAPPPDPRRPRPLPEAVPQVQPVIPPRVSTARSQAFPVPMDPRHPGVLPEATTKVSPVVPPRVGTARSQAFPAPMDPRRPGVLPEATPRVSPVVPPRVGTSRS